MRRSWTAPIAAVALFTLASCSVAQADPITMESGGTTYQFDPVLAATFFNNEFDTFLGFSHCIGSIAFCDSSNRPPAPTDPPPAPDPAEAQAFAIFFQNSFFNGGALGSTTYLQFIDETGLNDVGTFSFAYNYVITPTQAVVGPLTAWTPISTVPLPATLSLFASGLAGLGWLSRRRKRGQAITARLIDEASGSES